MRFDNAYDPFGSNRLDSDGLKTSHLYDYSGITKVVLQGTPD